ncbi:hypothetical protein ACFW84_23780 [Streptomyces anulatus]|uniref:hypothetical protein n=1 Tax=Streptomyces anulatus TaxID=1892 RepID=UPI0036A5E1C7
MTVTVETMDAGDVAEPAGAPAVLGPAAAERQALIERWAERHGVDAAGRLAEAEDLADAVAAEITPENTTDTFNKSWRAWQRFCADADQGGWARHSRSMPGYMQRDGGWDDNASVGLA